MLGHRMGFGRATYSRTVARGVRRAGGARPLGGVRRTAGGRGTGRRTRSIGPAGVAELRICVIGKYPPIQGGVSMRTYRTAQALAPRGHAVHVVTNAKEVAPPFRMHM